MAFDLTQLTAKNLPWRWARIAQWLVDSEPAQLAALDDDYKAVMQYADDMDVLESNPAKTIVSVASKTATSVLFNISSADIDLPVTFDYSENHSKYGEAAPSAPGSAGTDLTVSNGQWNKTGLTAGSQYAFSFAATDADGTEGAVTNILGIVLQPAVPANLNIADTRLADWDDSPGAASYSVRYTINDGDPVTVSVVNSTYTVAGSSGDDISIQVAAVNPGGMSNYCAADTVKLA